MPTIVVSPLSANNTPAFEVVNLSILAPEADWLGYFDLIEVWRSRSTSGGPYEELTASAWLPARLPKGGGPIPSSPGTGPSVNIVGLQLEFLLKERDTVLVIPTGTNPLSFAQVATQIGQQSTGRLRAYVDEDAHLVVETMEPGTGATLRVVPGDAAVFLALPLEEPDSLAFGRDARIQLQQNVTSYTFSDISGSTAFYYKTRFRNRSTGAVSEYSLPFSVAQAVGVSPANLANGYLRLVDLAGKPIAGREVSLYGGCTGVEVEGHLLVGGALTKSTDSAGYVEFVLVRGQKYSLAIAGVDLSKELTVPTDATVTNFSLVDPSISTQDDYFAVRRPDIPLMERRHI